MAENKKWLKGKNFLMINEAAKNGDELAKEILNMLVDDSVTQEEIDAKVDEWHQKGGTDSGYSEESDEDGDKAAYDSLNSEEESKDNESLENKEDNNESQPLYAELVQYSNDDSEEYNLAKEWIVEKGGRGLSEALSRPDDDLNELGQKVKQAIIKSAKPSPSNFVVYRTDDTNWLNDAKIGDVHKMNLFINASLDENVTIKENVGKVKQKIKINVKKGDPILAVSNANEKEVDLVKTNEDYGLKILNITEDDGVPVYEVEMYR